MNAYFPNYVFLKNVIIGTTENGGNWSSFYPANNFFPSLSNDVRFVDDTNPIVSLRNYRLRATSPASPYLNQGTDGFDVGANIDVVENATCGVVTGIPCGFSTSQTIYSHRTTNNLLTPIEVEDFDNGGQGIAYNETFGSSSSASYRSNPTENVDVIGNGNASNGFAVFEAGAGEWMEYSVNIPSNGLYSFAIRYASEFNNGKFHIEVCEANGTGVTNCVSSPQLTANSTGNWSTYQNLTTSMNLLAGNKILRLVMDTNSPDSCNCVVANFDKITASVNANKQFDFDGDGKADIGVFRPSTGIWYLLNSQTGFSATQFGTNGDKPTSANYDGDNKTDLSIFRPNGGVWYYLSSINGGSPGAQFGTNTDIPTQGDFTGDGKADFAFFRPSTGTWYVLRSENQSFYAFPFGLSTDIPTPSDYDGDGKTDAAVFRPSNGTWYIIQSQSGAVITTVLGINGDIPTAGDFDGDGKSDVSVFRPSTGTWIRINSSNSQSISVQHGSNGDIPTPADYDGDGKTDFAVFRQTNGTWYLLRSQLGALNIPFGSNGDIPVSKPIGSN